MLKGVAVVCAIPFSRTTNQWEAKVRRLVNDRIRLTEERPLGSDIRNYPQPQRAVSATGPSGGHKGVEP